MASHRRLASNVGVGLLALSVFVLGAQTNTAVMLASENQSVASAPGNDGKKDNNSEQQRGNSGNSSPGDQGNSSPGNQGNGASTTAGNSAPGNSGNGSPGAPGNGSSGPQGNGSPGAQQPAPPVGPSEPTRGNPGAAGNGGNGTGGNGPGGGPRSEPTIVPLPSPWPTAATPGGGNPAQQGVHNEVGICHRTGSGFQYLVADDNSGLYQGHLQHGGDKFNVSEAQCGNPTVESTVVPSPSATAAAPTPDPRATPVATAPTAEPSPTATPTGVTVPAGTPTAVNPTPENPGNGNGNGPEDENNDQDGDTNGDGPRAGGVLSTGSDGESRGESGQLGQGIALAPATNDLAAVGHGPSGEVLSGAPEIPQRMPARQAGPATAAGGGNAIAQIPSIRPAAPAVLPTTGEGDQAPFQGWAALGLVLFASGSILTRIGRRAEI